MMSKRTIWKYPLGLPIWPVGWTLRMPEGAHILHVDVQGETPTIWADVDTEARPELRRFDVFGTGYPVRYQAGTPGKYIGSGMSDSGFVWHVYERGEPISLDVCDE